MSGGQGRVRWRVGRIAAWVGRAVAVVGLVVGLGAVAGGPHGAVGGAQPGGGTPDAAQRPRPAGVCAVPDPAARPPSDDGTGGDPGAFAAAEATPDPDVLALQTDIERVVDALAACLSAGQYETVAELATDRYLGVLAGTGGVLTDDAYIALVQSLPVVPVTIRAIADVRREGTNTAGADVVYVVANQLVHGRWTFVHPVDPNPGSAADTTPAAGAAPTGERWLVDGEQPLPVAPPPDATRIAVELDEYEIDLERTEVDAAGGDVVLAVRNAGEREHELLVLRLAGETEPSDLLRSPGPSLPAGFTFVGQVTLPPDTQAELILVGLEPGRYALVSLLPDESGAPGLERGMEAEMLVE